MGVIIVVIVGTTPVWSQIDNLTGPDRNLSAVLQVAGGVYLAVVGTPVWVAVDSTSYKFISGLLTGEVLVVGTGVVLVPL